MKIRKDVSDAAVDKEPNSKNVHDAAIDEEPPVVRNFLTLLLTRNLIVIVGSTYLSKLLTKIIMLRKEWYCWGRGTTLYRTSNLFIPGMEKSTACSLS